MEIRFNLTGAARKALVEAIGGIVGWAPVYKKAPTFAYVVNNYTVDKNGTLICDERMDSGDVHSLLTELVERGFVYEDISGQDSPAEDAPADAPLPEDTEAVTGAKHLSFKAPGAEKFTRCREGTLGEDYTEDAIRERIAGRRAAPVRRGGIPKAATQKPGLLIDIQARLQAGKGAGYERWAKIFNLKQAAQTLNYLQEHGNMSYEELAEKSSAATARYNTISNRLKELETALNGNASLQKQIVNYSKTRAVYTEYRKAGYSKRFREAHEADILLHQAAKKHFDESGFGKDKKLPTVATLRLDYGKQLDEKKTLYREYHQARDEMRELLVVKANVDRLLNIPDRTSEREPDAPTL